MESNVEEFLKVAGDFQLGSLDTEAQHPLSVHLSQQAVEDLPLAIRTLQEIDRLALRRFVEKSSQLAGLAEAIRDTLAAGSKIFLCGCGATGRLSLSVEVFCREGMVTAEEAERVIGFMAGGDLALIKAIENFEDHPEFGARQLEELGFSDGDLLISSTEGGETPFVIGATERAAELSTNKPYFLYCNPDAELIAVAQRSQRVIENDGIIKMNLSMGPMAISGSTRMQASTVLMAAIGFAFLSRHEPESAERLAADFLEMVEGMNFRFLAKLIELEAEVYQKGDHVLYEPGPFGITVLTDTTERAPTFALAPFENQNVLTQSASWCHLLMPDCADGASAWRALLHREPRTLEWPEVASTAGKAVLEGYDISAALLEKRALRVRGRQHHHFKVSPQVKGFVLEFCGQRAIYAHQLCTGGERPNFFNHLALKLALNTHSTLIMGRLGRYQDNLMTYVKPSNLKLIDRAIRYVQLLMQRRNGMVPTYEQTARVLFREIETLQVGEPVVLKTLAALSSGKGREKW